MWRVARLLQVGNSREKEAQMPSADLTISNARLLTMNKSSQRAQAITPGRNRILGIGSNAEVLAHRARHTCLVDAQQNMVTPSIIEGHIHLFRGAAELNRVMINHFNCLMEISQAVNEYAKAHFDDDGIIAYGASHVSHWGSGWQ
jgi:predicted amidohydrolase YtcJ